MTSTYPIWDCKCKFPCYERYINGKFGYVYNAVHGGIKYSSKMWNLINEFDSLYKNATKFPNHRCQMADVYACCVAGADGRVSKGCHLQVTWFDQEYMDSVNHHEYDGKETPYVDYTKYCLLRLLRLRGKTDIKNIQDEFDEVEQIARNNGIL